MITIKSFSVGNGDMFYVSQRNSLITIDCYWHDDNKQKQIISEIRSHSLFKSNTYFISTHPDKDHIEGLPEFDKFVGIRAFYCTKNAATKPDDTVSFRKYCELRDSEKARYIQKGLSIPDSSIHFLWPNVANSHYQEELKKAAKGQDPNNLSPIFALIVPRFVSAMWMGDIEHDFLDTVKWDINWRHIDILFAPHHGRKSGMIPADILRKISPKLIVIGEADSEYLHYYSGYNTITQNSAGDITFVCDQGCVHVYVSEPKYSLHSGLQNRMKYNSSHGYYVGSFTPTGG